jgi:hypothetical protein
MGLIPWEDHCLRTGELGDGRILDGGSAGR